MVRAANRRSDVSVVEQRICPWKDGSRVTQEQLPRSYCRGAFLVAMTPFFRLIRVSLGLPTYILLFHFDVLYERGQVIPNQREKIELDTLSIRRKMRFDNQTIFATR